MYEQSSKKRAFVKGIMVIIVAIVLILPAYVLLLSSNTNVNVIVSGTAAGEPEPSPENEPEPYTPPSNVVIYTGGGGSSPPRQQHDGSDDEDDDSIHCEAVLLGPSFEGNLTKWLPAGRYIVEERHPVVGYFVNQQVRLRGTDESNLTIKLKLNASSNEFEGKISYDGQRTTIMGNIDVWDSATFRTHEFSWNGGQYTIDGKLDVEER